MPKTTHKIKLTYGESTMNNNENTMLTAALGVEQDPVPNADFNSDAEYDAYFEEKKLSLTSPVRKALFGIKYLAFCFLVPTVLMALIYVALGVWPVGERSALVLDLNAQYVYYIEKFRSILLDGGSFLYTFERALGGEFMGIFAYYVASPFNLLTLIFPKEWMTEVVLGILLLKCGCCGLTFGIYCHNSFEKRRPIATLIFSTMYALCSFAVVMQNNLMWTDCIILLPIILLGMDALIRYGRYKLYTLSLALAIFSNFYIGYMMCIFLLFYYFVRYFSMTREERNPNGIRFQFPRRLIRMLIFSVIAVMIAAVVITCAYYSLSFGKLEFSTPDFTPKQLYDFSQIISKFFFGTYDTVRPEGIPFLYAGMLMTLLAPLYFVTPGIAPKKKVGAGFMMLLFIVSINLSTADLIWHGFQRPNWLNARFTFMFIFLMLIMAYEVLIRIKELGFSKVVASGAVSVLILLVLQHFEYEHLPDFRAIWASIGIIGVYLLVLRFAYMGARRSYVTLSAVFLALLVSVDLFASGIVDLYAFNADVTYAKRNPYREFLDKYYVTTEYVDSLDDGSFYREEKLAHRKTNDNFALGIKGISNSTSTLNAGIIDFLNDLGFTSKSHWSKYVGGTILSDSLLGIRYLHVDLWEAKLPDYVSRHYKEIYKSDDGIAIYENPYAMSVAFAVDSAIKDFKFEENTALSNPFEYMNDLFALTTGIENLEIWQARPASVITNSGNRKFGVQDNHVGYEKNDTSAAATVTYKFTAVDDSPVFMYIPTKWPRKASFSVNGVSKSLSDASAETDANGNTVPAETNTKKYVTNGTYFTNDTHAIVEIGRFTKGKEITVTFTQSEEKMYTLNSNNYFYSFNEDTFMNVADKLSPSQLDVNVFEEDRIEGVVSVPSDGTLYLTTIPYDEGWHVLCDGEEIEIAKSLDSLMSFELDEGEHKIEMYYMSDSFKFGATVSLTGLGLFVLICIGEWILPYLWLLLKNRREAARKTKAAAVSVANHDSVDVPDTDAFAEDVYTDEDALPTAIDGDGTELNGGSDDNSEIINVTEADSSIEETEQNN